MADHNKPQRNVNQLNPIKLPDPSNLPSPETDPPTTPYDNVADRNHTVVPQTSYDNVPASVDPPVKVDVTNADILVEAIQDINLEQNNNESEKEPKEAEDENDFQDKSESDDVYDFTHKLRGKALIFSFAHFLPESQQNDRSKASIEGLKLSVLMKCLGFIVEFHNDKTKEEMEHILLKAAAEDHTERDCLVCIISSHGQQVAFYPEKHLQERTDIVYASNAYLFLEDILNNFTENNCPTLKGKPKLFFIQACRGTKVSEMVELAEPAAPGEGGDTTGEGQGDAEPDGGDSENIKMDQDVPKDWKPQPYVCFNYPCYKDFMVSCCTLPGYFAFRNSERSWFLLELFTELQSCCNDLELMQIMERVNFNVAYNYRANTFRSTNPADWALDGKGQMPWTQSMLLKQVYLKPVSEEYLKNVKALDWFKWNTFKPYIKSK